ncbi:gamma-glutamylcyclotransferase [Paenibacillus caui]|uniref:gamma-glutamylcyclotransferase n=1 Tax=Paenibacillus caui TaxID=2873927 RepID=UPI001CA95925|nr:gamma-glutamylcyclotransferase family protein [Paenibacillus caui]
MKDDLVFVYGTLREGESNHGFMKGIERVAEQARTTGTLWDTGNGYPAMTVDNGSESFVYGEVYRIPEGGMDALDVLEDYYGPNDRRNEYERISAAIQVDTGTLQAWTYIYKSEQIAGLTPIRCGDWKMNRLLDEGEEPSVPAKELFYFAYGSCMDDRRFLLQGVDRHFLNQAGRGVAKGYRLAFTYRATDGGRADIIETGGIVEGKLYRIGNEALAYLWQREGVAAGSYRPAFIRVDSDEMKGKVEALTFIVLDKKEESSPPSWYLEEIIRGAATVVSPAYFLQLKEMFRTRFGYEYC